MPFKPIVEFDQYATFELRPDETLCVSGADVISNIVQINPACPSSASYLLVNGTCPRDPRGYYYDHVALVGANVSCVGTSGVVVLNGTCPDDSSLVAANAQCSEYPGAGAGVNGICS